MKTPMLATRIRLALATAAAGTALVTAVNAEDGGIRWENCTPAELFTNPQQYGPKPVPAWKQHSWERDNLLDWESGTKAWRESARKPEQHLLPAVPEGLPSEDTFGSFGTPNAPPLPPDLGVPARPDRTYGLNQGYRNGYDNSERFGELPPAPPTRAIHGRPSTPRPQRNVAQPQEKQTDWGALFGGVADSLKGTMN